MLNLNCRGIRVSPTCPLCSCRDETTLHALWGCRRLKEVTSTLPIDRAKIGGEGMLFFDFILGCLGCLDLAEICLLCVVFWKNWYDENQKVKDLNTVTAVNDVVGWSRIYISDFQDSKHPQAIESNQQRVGTVIWKPLKLGMYKINTDATINQMCKKVGFGIVIQNTTGFVMACSSQCICATFSPQVAEVEAILRGLQFARDSELLPATIESDVVVVVKWINEKSNIRADVGLILDDILSLINSMA
ncbi:hypothetical protein Dsin_025040 [Dipteronia sinensis]|uniref:RNase H type-1 domain-containing protein n=1 Tax=Dipteronia sinensis TaxID=43782 RepID=A0AAD9ZUU9_9ROSI|nr:hypothetical protein Dsin_025040 [Dipteronia sinensis]